VANPWAGRGELARPTPRWCREERTERPRAPYALQPLQPSPTLSLCTSLGARFLPFLFVAKTLTKAKRRLLPAAKQMRCLRQAVRRVASLAWLWNGLLRCRRGFGVYMYMWAGLARHGTGPQKHGPQRHDPQKHISNYGPCRASTCVQSSAHGTAHN
jgi:hypothetical protein